MLSPRNWPSGRWDGLFEQLDELLEYVSEKLPVDEGAFFVTGYSIGGTGTWQYALRAPERFAAIVPVAGAATASRVVPVPDEICLLGEMPVLIYHGDEDTAVPIESNIANVEVLRACGNDAVSLTIYEGMDHSGTWQMAYADPALYAWMLEQSK